MEILEIIIKQFWHWYSPNLSYVRILKILQ